MAGFGNGKWRRSARKRLRAYQGGRCFYCAVVLTPSSGACSDVPDAATLDHVVPRARGGSGDVSNVVLACLACNRAKADADPADHHVEALERRNRGPRWRSLCNHRHP